jgi:sRNA-binding carbon storage regulator CsrA
MRDGWKIITRRPHQQILLSGRVVITVLKITDQEVQLRIDAPHEIIIQPKELWDRVSPMQRGRP